jgi:hypothetical protein
MKKVLLVLLTLLTQVAYSQPVVFSWARQFGGKNTYEGSAGITRDGAGNIYVTGEFSGSKLFGPFTLTAQGFSEVFIAKFNPAGTCQWAVKAGANFSTAYAGKIAISGNTVYVTGNFTNLIEIGSFATSSSGNKDIFIAGLNTSNGNCQFLEKAGGSYNDVGLNIAPAAGGGFLLCGTFTSTATFGTLQVSSSSIIDRDLFFAKYDNSGVCQWVKRIGNTSEDIANVIKELPNGDILLGGSYEGSVQFGPGVTLNAVAFSDLFLAKFNPSGNLIWAASAGGENTDVVYGLDYDLSGNIFITGFIADTANFGSIVVNNAGNIQVFVAKYNSSGVPQWVRTGGNIQDDIGYDVAVDAGGSAYVTGYINGNANFSGTTVTGVQSYDGFVAKYDPTGILRWITKVGGTGFDQGKAIINDASGFCLTVGDFTNTVFFGITQMTPNNPGTYEIYLTRVGGGSVGLEENDTRFFGFYPNPARDLITLDLSNVTDAVFTVEVVSIDGKLVSSRLIDQTHNLKSYNLPVDQLAKGSYLLRLVTSQGDYHRKLVIQ